MSFKDKKILELEEQLENADLTDDEKDKIQQKIDTLRSGKSHIPWAWIILAGIAVGIIFFGSILAAFLKAKPRSASEVSAGINKGQAVKPPHYSSVNFAVAKKQKAPEKNSSSKLNSEFAMLKRKVNIVGTTVGSSAVKAVTPAGGIIFVNPAYLKEIKEAEGVGTQGGQAKSAATSYLKTASPANAVRGGNVIIPVGAVISAYTKYELYSYNTKVPVIAIVSSPYSFMGKLVIPAGYEFMGSVSGHTQSRLNITFNQIINPKNGKSITVHAIAVMDNGSAGITGNAHYHVVKNILSGIGSGILSGLAMFSGGGSAANSTGAYTYQDTLRQNVAQNEANYAQNSLSNAAQNENQIVITLPSRTPIKIMFMSPLKGE